MSRSVSLVVPAYNEAGRLPSTLEVLARRLPEFADEAEIVVVDDGSTDATPLVAADFRGAVPVRCVSLDQNRGKGFAVGRGVASATHDYIAFMDADTPYDLEALGCMLDELKAGRADVVIGARDLPDSEINRGYGLLRYLSGQIFSGMTWLAIGLPFRDSQCGLKAFRADVARDLFAARTIDGFGFDFEILAACVENDVRVKPVPVRLTHDDDSRIRIVRDSLRMCQELWRVRRRQRAGAYRLRRDEVESISCPLCGCEPFAPRAARDGYRMVECVRCGLWYLNPAPLEETLSELYRERYYASSSPLDSGYADYAAMAEDFHATFADRLELVRPHVGDGRIVDVGAGFGFLLDVARPLFSERWAVELSDEAAAQIADDHRIARGDWQSVDLPAGHFDVVSMQDCLEHLRDPRAALAKVRKVLRPGGAFLAVTPDTGSWLARVQGADWVSLKFPEHVLLYSEKTLRRLLSEEGFVVRAMVPARQYVRLGFLAHRVAGGAPRVGDSLARGLERLGWADRRVHVPSGSLTVVATRE